MANPKIVYDLGSGPVTLNFQYPPRRVPAYFYEAVRHDNVASSGVRETITERIDQFLALEMEWVLSGVDISAWSAFMVYALSGGQFSYYPDGAQSGFTNYWLEDTRSSAEFKAPGQVHVQHEIPPGRDVGASFERGPGTLTMIIGNPTWQSALLQPNKQPLYVLEIADYSLFLASFTSGANVTLGGYGVVTFGVGGYGT